MRKLLLIALLFLNGAPSFAASAVILKMNGPNAIGECDGVTSMWGKTMSIAIKSAIEQGYEIKAVLESGTVYMVHP